MAVLTKTLEASRKTTSALEAAIEIERKALIGIELVDVKEGNVEIMQAELAEKEAELVTTKSESEKKKKEYTDFANSIKAKIATATELKKQLKNPIEKLQTVVVVDESELVKLNEQLKSQTEVYNELLAERTRMEVTIESSEKSLKSSPKVEKQEDFWNDPLELHDVMNTEDRNLKQSESERESLAVSLNEKKVEIASLTSKHQVASNTVNESIKKTKEEQVNIREQLSKISDEVKEYQILEHVLGEDGIKKFILKDVVPFLNKEINRYLMAFNININCYFNEDFKPKLYRFGKEAQESSISSGQRMIVNSCIVVAITKIFLKKYSNLNIVFYDELFANLHVTNIPLILDLVNEIVIKELKLKPFLVNHAPVSNSYFQQEIMLKNDGFFSHIEIKNNRLQET